MGSFTQLSYHIVFTTKYRRPTITDTMQERLYEYIGGTIRAKGGHLIEMGGVNDHVLILGRLTPALAVADVVRDIKANSSKVGLLGGVTKTVMCCRGFLGEWVNRCAGRRSCVLARLRR